MRRRSFPPGSRIPAIDVVEPVLQQRRSSVGAERHQHGRSRAWPGRERRAEQPEVDDGVLVAAVEPVANLGIA